MNTTYETERELAVFIGVIGHYFHTIGGALPDFRAPSIELALPARLDCTGYMPVSGRLDGWIALSLPSPLLRELLARMGEEQHDETAQLDLVAEITSTLTSNAREHFGEHLRVAPPLSTSGPGFPDELSAPPLSFRLPFQWQGADAFLLIALQR